VGVMGPLDRGYLGVGPVLAQTDVCLGAYDLCLELKGVVGSSGLG